MPKKLKTEEEKQDKEKKENTDIIPIPRSDIAREEDAIDINLSTLNKRLKSIQDFQVLVRTQLHEGQDFGTIPGCGDKPTLLKPGAEKIVKLLGLADLYDTELQTIDFDKPFFDFHYKCKLISIRTGVLISEGVGEANSLESKFRYRWVYENKLSPEEKANKANLKTKKFKGKDNNWYTQYRVENDDIYSLVNTIKKTSKKRALVDAALSCGRLSNLFTQDLDDLKDVIDVEPEASSEKIKTSMKIEKPKVESQSAPKAQEPKPQPEISKTTAASKSEPSPEKKEEVIGVINKMIETKTFDKKDFKLFLYDFQKTHKVKFVDYNNFKKLSFHEGDYDDLTRLISHFDYMCGQYLIWVETKAKKVEETEIEEPPF